MSGQTPDQPIAGILMDVIKAQAEQLATLTALVQRLADQVHQHGRTMAVLRAEIEALRTKSRH
jgi:hypothetical protein